MARHNALPLLLVAAPLGAPDDPVAPPRFRAAPDSPIAVGPMAGRPVAGDVDRDGALDLVVACGACCGSKPDPTSGHVVVLLGDGSGGFAPAKGSPVVVGPSVRKVALGDLDGDGDLDVAAAEHDRHELVLLRNDGKGAFAPWGGVAPSVMNGPIAKPDGTSGVPDGHTHDVAIADVDRDGRNDLLATSVSAHGLAILLQRADGSFAHAEGSPIRVRAPYDAIAIAELDVVDSLDLAVPSIAGEAVHALLGDGKGRFQQVRTSPIQVAARPGYVAAADLDGDGVNDLIATHDDVPLVTLLKNDSNGGFAPMAGSPLKPKVDGFFWGIAPADWNGDGKVDLALALANQSEVVILCGDGKGRFAPEPFRFETGSQPGYVIAADLDGDGLPDLVTGNYGSGDLTILMNDGD